MFMVVITTSINMPMSSKHLCRDLLLAMHHVPQDFDPDAIQRVLACMTPEAARIMWASKTFKVCRASIPRHVVHSFYGRI